MNLSNEEKRFYEDIFQKTTSAGQSLNKSNCQTLLTKGIKDPVLCDKVWGLVSENGTKPILRKKDLFRLLKYIAAYQNGYKVEEVSLKDLPELPNPNLQKKKKNKNKRGEDKQAEAVQNPSTDDSSPTMVATTKKTDRETANQSPQIGDVNTESMGSPSTDSQVSDKDNVKCRDTEEFGETAADILEKDDSRHTSIYRDLEEDTSQKLEPSKVLRELEIKVLAPISTDYCFKFENTTQASSSEKFQFSPVGVPLKDGLATEAKTSESKKEKVVTADSVNIASMRNLKYDEYLQHIENIKIEIFDTVTYNSGFLGYGTYTTYFIKSTYPGSEGLEAERRYSDFDWLNLYFRSCSQYKGLAFPKLPEKKSIGNTDREFIQQRRADLEIYLREVSRHKVLSQDAVLKVFLGEESKEEFQALKERKLVNGVVVIPDLDWQKMKEVYEYAMASMKVKLQKEGLPSEWKESNEKIYDVLRVDGMIKKVMKTLEKKQELYKSMKTINTNYNVMHTKIMNRANEESYYAIGSLSSLLVAQARNMQDESFITEDLIKEIKRFKTKVDSCKESYALLISTLQEIGTQKELHNVRQAKLFEYKAENNYGNIVTVAKELSEIEKKIEQFEKETLVIRDNLNLEAETLSEQL